VLQGPYSLHSLVPVAGTLSIAGGAVRVHNRQGLVLASANAKDVVDAPEGGDEERSVRISTLATRYQ
jgi:hypothetical protein